ncbi:hypothetical protein BVI434_3170007 [Burkholderia vietnamiensis]|nr:hypothetical protein BVI434_3170007 [Burkholderia vietnamiensis]
MREDAAQAARPAGEDPAERPLSAHQDHAARVHALSPRRGPSRVCCRLVFRFPPGPPS